MKAQAFARVAVLTFVLSSQVGAQAWDSSLPKLLDGLASNYWQPSLKTAFGTFTYEYTDLPTPFSRWFEERLASAMTQNENLKLFNRSAAAAMDPTFKAIYSDFFKSNGVDGLLYGRYFDEGDAIRARIELTGLADGLLIGTLDLRIPKKALPQGLVLSPTQAASTTAAGISTLLPTRVAAVEEKNALTVSISTERGPGAVYREGEELVVLVAVNKEAFVKIYQIDVNGIVQLIWPNRFGGGGSIRPGRAVGIPATTDPFRFKMTPPFGTEFIKVVASTRPFAAKESDFSVLGNDPRGIITRGVEVVPVLPQAQTGLGSSPAGDGELAEAMASYLIIEAKR